jgi:hypothetical protein
VAATASVVEMELTVTHEFDAMGCNLSHLQHCKINIRNVQYHRELLDNKQRFCTRKICGRVLWVGSTSSVYATTCD